MATMGRPPIGPKVQAAIPQWCFDIMDAERVHRSKAERRDVPLSEVIREAVERGCIAHQHDMRKAGTSTGGRLPRFTWRVWGLNYGDNA